jgi:hypothetical protein
MLRSELAALGNPALDEVLAAFGRHRLLSFDRDPVTRGPTVELAHEALLTEWSRLRGWVERARDDLRAERRLTAAAAEWQAAGEEPDYLLHGTRLELLAAWADRTDLALPPPVRQYLDASTAHRAAEQAAADEQRRHEATVTRRSRRRARALLAVSVVTVLVVALAVVAWAQRREANRLSDETAVTAQARRLATSASDQAARDPELALLLALQSIETSRRGGCRRCRRPRTRSTGRSRPLACLTRYETGRWTSGSGREVPPASSSCRSGRWSAWLATTSAGCSPAPSAPPTRSTRALRRAWRRPRAPARRHSRRLRPLARRPTARNRSPARP